MSKTPCSASIRFGAATFSRVNALACAILLALLAGTPLACGQSPELVPLPPPDTTGGAPLMEVLANRMSVREFSEEPLEMQQLSNLLWAAFGINRPDGHRTAPSAHNYQEIDLYVATADACYRYLPEEHALAPVVDEDLRAETGTQEYVATAAVTIVYVADYADMTESTAEEQEFYAATDTGFIAQNVYLFCASEGLACVVRGGIDRESLAERLDLRPEQHITLMHAIGRPATED